MDHYCDLVLTIIVGFSFISILLLKKKLEDEKRNVNTWRDLHEKMQVQTWKMARAFRCGGSYSAATTNEMCDDGEAMRRWQDEHPYGAVTQAEHEEWNELIMQQIGSYMLFCEAHGYRIDADHIDVLWEQVEGWRV